MMIDRAEQHKFPDSYGRCLLHVAISCCKTVLQQCSYCVSPVLCMMSSSGCAEMSLIVHALHVQKYGSHT